MAPNLQRLFLDTNVIWNLNTFGEEIIDAGHFDGEMIYYKYGKRVLDDLLALAGIYSNFRLHGDVEFAADPKAIEEMASRSRDETHENRIIFADELLEWWYEQLQAEHPSKSSANPKRKLWLS